MNKVLPWWKPEIVGTEAALLQDVLDSNFLNDGEVTADFEARISARVGAKHAVATTSGTSALYLSLLALGIGHGDEVIVPDLTFIATANAVTMTGARAVLVDIDPETLSLSSKAFERALGSRTRAVMPVHISGRAGSFQDVYDLANRYGLPLVEDAAEALGSKFHDRFLGTWGVMGCFSFSPNKTITTGQGGMIVTDDDALALRLRELKDQGRPVRGTGGDDLHPKLGFNFKFTNLQAAIGIGQLSALDHRLRRQARIFEIYREELADCAALTFFNCNTGASEVPQWTDVLAESRNDLESYLRAQNVHCRKFWHPLHRQIPYAQADSLFPHSSRLAEAALWLPSAFQMTDEDTQTVASLIKTFYQGVKKS